MKIRSVIIAASTAILATVAISPIALADTSGSCGGTKTEFVSCSDQAGVGAIGDLIKIAIFVVTAVIGVTAVGFIAYAAILYASARDNKSQVEQAMGIVRNVVVGLVMYGLTIALINWLVPGGVIG